MYNIYFGDRKLYDNLIIEIVYATPWTAFRIISVDNINVDLGNYVAFLRYLCGKISRRQNFARKRFSQYLRLDFSHIRITCFLAVPILLGHPA